MRIGLSLNKQVSHQEIVSNIEKLLQKFVQENGSQDLSEALLIIEIKNCIPATSDYHIQKIECKSVLPKSPDLENMETVSENYGKEEKENQTQNNPMESRDEEQEM